MLLHASNADSINMAVNCAAFSPDGRQALTVADDKTARLWDVESGKELRRLVGMADEVGVLAFVADGHGIVAVSSQGMVWRWDATSGTALVRPMVPAKQEPTPSIGERSIAWPVVLFPNGRRVSLAGWNGVNGVWDVETGKQIHNFAFKAPKRLFAAAFSPDGRRLLTSTGAPFASLWDVDTGKETQHFTVNPEWRPPFLYPEGDTRDGVVRLALSPDERRALTSDSEGSIRLWDVATGNQVRVLKVHTLGPLAVGFTADSRKMITENANGSATMCDVKRGREFQHFGKASRPVFSADGRRVLMGDSVWDAATGKELMHFAQPQGTEPFETLSSDGSKVLTGDADGFLRQATRPTHQTHQDVRYPIIAHCYLCFFTRPT